jgi:hypothetical protein
LKPGAFRLWVRGGQRVQPHLVDVFELGAVVRGIARCGEVRLALKRELLGHPRVGLALFTHAVLQSSKNIQLMPRSIEVWSVYDCVAMGERRAL